MQNFTVFFLQVCPLNVCSGCKVDGCWSCPLIPPPDSSGWLVGTEIIEFGTGCSMAALNHILLGLLALALARSSFTVINLCVYKVYKVIRVTSVL